MVVTFIFYEQLGVKVKLSAPGYSLQSIFLWEGGLAGMYVLMAT